MLMSMTPARPRCMFAAKHVKVSIGFSSSEIKTAAANKALTARTPIATIRRIVFLLLFVHSIPSWPPVGDHRLRLGTGPIRPTRRRARAAARRADGAPEPAAGDGRASRSEERRVGKEGGGGCAP